MIGRFQGSHRVRWTRECSLAQIWLGTMHVHLARTHQVKQVARHVQILFVEHGELELRCNSENGNTKKIVG